MNKAYLYITLIIGSLQFHCSAYTHIYHSCRSVHVCRPISRTVSRPAVHQTVVSHTTVSSTHSVKSVPLHVDRICTIAKPTTIVYRNVFNSPQYHSYDYSHRYPYFYHPYYRPIIPSFGYNPFLMYLLLTNHSNNNNTSTGIASSNLEWTNCNTNSVNRIH